MPTVEDGPVVMILHVCPAPNCQWKLEASPVSAAATAMFQKHWLEEHSMLVAARPEWKVK